MRANGYYIINILLFNAILFYCCFILFMFNFMMNYYAHNIGFRDRYELNCLEYNLRLELNNLQERIKHLKEKQLLMKLDYCSMMERYHVYRSRQAAIEELEDHCNFLRSEIKSLRNHLSILALKKKKKRVKIRWYRILSTVTYIKENRVY